MADPFPSVEDVQEVARDAQSLQPFLSNEGARWARTWLAGAVPHTDYLRRVQHAAANGRRYDPRSVQEWHDAEQRGLSRETVYIAEAMEYVANALTYWVPDDPR